jgi:hypothetical protein
MRLLAFSCFICTVIRGDYTTDERAGLVSLYAATGGASSWTSSIGWNTSADVCTWFGIFCFAGVVTTIALANNSLSGNLVDAGPALWQLTELQVLDLSSNELAGPLPAGLSLLTKLTKLDVSSNQLSTGLRQTARQVQNLAADFRVYVVTLQNMPTISGTSPASLPSVLATLDMTDKSGITGSIFEANTQHRLLQQQCAPGTYTSTSDGVSSCRQCPAGTYRYDRTL